MSLALVYSPLVLFGISTLFWWMILTPISIHYLSRYYQHRNDISIRHRHWKLVLLFGSFCIFFWCIERPLEFIWKLKALNLNPFTLRILGYIHYIIFPITVHGFIWCMVWRYYMIYFNIRFYEENINMKWKIIINYSMNSKKQKFNWFLLHKQTYGALKWLSPRIVILFIAIISILIFTQFYHPLIASVLDGIVSFCAIPILLTLWYKTPIIDHFHLGTEYVYIIILCLIEWCFYFGGSILNMVVFGNNPKSSYYDEDITFVFIQSWTGVLFAFSIVVICTKWTLHKCHIKSSTSASASTASLRSVSSRSVVIQSNPALAFKQHNIQRKVTLSPRGRQLKLYECLQCGQSFNCFMNHLMSEFSHECLLSTLEFIQFKKGLCYSYTDMLGTSQLVLRIPATIRHNMDLNDKNGNSSSSEDTTTLSPQSPPLLITTGSVLSAASVSDCSSIHSHNTHNNTKREILTCHFPVCVPQSFIVFKSNNNTNAQSTCTKQDVLKEYKRKAHLLFEKYIYNAHHQCPYEININYNMRKRLINLMGNKNVWINNTSNDISTFDELYTLFDDCILEMYDLMCHSFARFKKTNEFAKLDKKIFCKSSFPDTFLN